MKIDLKYVNYFAELVSVVVEDNIDDGNIASGATRWAGGKSR